jgi:hypothetical protein
LGCFQVIGDIATGTLNDIGHFGGELLDLVHTLHEQTRDVGFHALHVPAEICGFSIEVPGSR